jgi:predicted metal-dependent peptidase
MTPHVKALERAKIQLMTKPDSVFFTQVCFSMKHIFTTDVATAATNGTYIKFNPEFFMSLDTEEQLFLILHETLHVALLHMLRAENLDAQKFNMAADYVINDMLILRGYKMPKCGLHDVRYRGMSVRQVYDLLPDNPSNTGWDDLVAPDGTDGTDGKSAAAKAAKEAITDIVVRAAIQSKVQGDSAGTIPMDVQVFLDGLLKPKLPTKVILQRYMTAMAKDDYTWRKPNRRYFPKLHLPSLYSESLN